MKSIRGFLLLLALPVGLMRILLDTGKEPQKKKHSGTRASSDERKETFQLDPNKPTLILHVGPPKTGTSPIQDDLFHSLSEELLKDNIYYADDNYYGSASPLMQEALNGVFQRKNCKNKPTALCVVPLRKLLSSYRDRKMVLLSSDGFAKRFSTPAHYQALYDSLSYEWNVVLIVGYRRFYEWLPSKAFQGYRMDQMQNAQWKVDWPGHKKGAAVELVFPQLWKQWQGFYGNKPTYTTDVLDANNGILPVKLLNLHDQHHHDESLTTHFVCHLLADAVHTCAASRAQDSDQRQLIGSTILEEDKDAVIHVFYDIVTTAAAERGLIDTALYERREIRESMQDYQERVRKKTAMDLDLKCPEQDELDEYLKRSRKYEKLVLGKKAAKASSEAHKAAFWTMAADRAFCGVDVETVLSQRVWQSFFAQYSAQAVSHHV